MNKILFSNNVKPDPLEVREKTLPKVPVGNQETHLNISDRVHELLERIGTAEDMNGVFEVLDVALEDFQDLHKLDEHIVSLEGYVIKVVLPIQAAEINSNLESLSDLKLNCIPILLRCWTAPSGDCSVTVFSYPDIQEHERLLRADLIRLEDLDIRARQQFLKEVKAMTARGVLDMRVDDPTNWLIGEHGKSIHLRGPFVLEEVTTEQANERLEKLKQMLELQ